MSRNHMTSIKNLNCFCSVVQSEGSYPTKRRRGGTTDFAKLPLVFEPILVEMSWCGDIFCAHQSKYISYLDILHLKVCFLINEQGK